MNNKEHSTGDYSVSVVMPSYYTGPVLLRSVKSVLSQKNLSELILIDNGNSNYVTGKIAEIAAQNSKLRIISGQGNIGFSRACNLGASEAKGDYLLLLNPDCILPNAAFHTVVRAMQRNPKAWVAGCHLVNPDGSEQNGNRRNIMDIHNLLCEWSGLYKYTFIPRVELYETIAPRGCGYIPAISGAFMMMETKRYFDIGGMDEGYFLHIEDMDFCFQVNEMGGKIIYVSDLEVTHYGHTSDVSSLFLNRHIANGLMRYFKKNYKGAYFPGAMLLIGALIYTRFALQTGFYCIKKIFKKIANPFPKKDNNNDYLPFLEEYRNFPVIDESLIKDARYILHNREPILLTNIDNQTGICILQRLLAANIRVIALYTDKPVDIYHPKLLWVKSDFKNKELDIPSDSRPATVICTSPIQYLTPNLDKLSAMGVKRIICFNTISVLSGAIDALTKKKAMAEQDIIRICNQKKIDYTILRHSSIYGLSKNSSIYLIYKFIRKFGFFPAIKEKAEIYAPVHAEDLAITAIKILNIEETYRKEYNLTGEEKTIRYEDLLDKLFNVAESGNAFSRSIFMAPVKKLARLMQKRKLNREILKYAVSEADPQFAANDDFGFDSRNFLNIEEYELKVKENR